MGLHVRVYVSGFRFRGLELFIFGAKGLWFMDIVLLALQAVCERKGGVLQNSRKGIPA